MNQSLNITQSELLEVSFGKTQIIILVCSPTPKPSPTTVTLYKRYYPVNRAQNSTKSHVFSCTYFPFNIVSITQSQQ